MAKKRTSKSKSSLIKKGRFFTKRKIVLGVALIALIGIGVVLYSNAAVGDPPVEKTLFCDQGNCYETKAAGSQRSDQKVFVRETNKLACASTGKEWATRANKAPAQWVCVKNEDPNATLVVPSNFVAVDTPCYTTVVPPTTVISPVPDPCQGTYNNNKLNLFISAIFNDQANYLDTAISRRESAKQDGFRIKSFNTNYIVNGQKAVKMVKQASGVDDRVDVEIIANTPTTQINNHSTTIVFYNKYLNVAPGSNEEKANIAADITIAQWQWKNLLTQNTQELAVASCFSVTVPSVSRISPSVCETRISNIELLPEDMRYNIEFGFTSGTSANQNYRNLADSFAAGYTSRGYVIEKRIDNATIGGIAAVSYEAVKPNEPNTRELLIFPDRKNTSNNKFFIRAKTYGVFKYLQDDVLASWKWL